MIIGIVGAVTGIVLMIVGGIKASRYSRLKETRSMNLRILEFYAGSIIRSQL